MADIPSTLSSEVGDKYTTENNTFVLEAKTDPKDFLEVEVGDIKQAEFYPQVKLERWTNEVNFSVRLVDIDYDKATVSTLTDKIVWDKDNIKIEFYDFAENEGGYKMIWYLKEKPVSNIVSFTIQSKGLDFFYQPALTPEEIAEGVFRPENVVGSYAVYHSTKGGMNDSAGKEYKTGKAFHIYRPHIIDSSGAEAWGILHIENGIYSVEIPQDFLDKAVYPIKSNDTFGYTVAGGSTTQIADLYAGSVFSGIAGTVTQLSASAYTGDWSSVPAAIYLHSDSSLLAQTNVSPVEDPGWFNFTFTSNPVVAAVDYVLVLMGDAYDTGLDYDSGSANQGHYESTTGTFSDPATFTHDNNKYSIYATYTPEGGGPDVNIDSENFEYTNRVKIF